MQTRTTTPVPRPRLLPALLLLAALLCPVACSRHVPTATEKAEADKKPNFTLPMDAAVFVERRAARKAFIVITNSRFNPDATLRAMVALRNPGNAPLVLEGRVKFFDKNRILSDDFSDWKPVTVQPHATALWEESSRTIRLPAYYYIELRLARKTKE